MNYLPFLGCLSRVSGGAAPVIKPTPPPPLPGIPTRYVTSGLASAGQTHYATMQTAIAGEWAGYNSQPFVTNQTATSADDLIAKILALTPNGTSWYRIGCSGSTGWAKTNAGTSSGHITIPSTLDFGSGGLLIEPESGQDPQIGMQIVFDGGRGIHFRNLRFIGVADPRTDMTARQAAYPAAMFNTPDAAFGSRTRSNLAIVKFENCTFGRMQIAGATDGDAYQWISGFKMLFAEQVIISNCQTSGVSAANTIFARYLRSDDNEFNQVMGTLHQFGTHSAPYTYPDSLFTDNANYLVIRRNAYRKPWDRMDLWPTDGDIAHRDFLQYYSDANQARPIYSILEDNVGLDGSITDFQSTYLGDVKYRTFSSSFIRVTMDNPIFSLVGFNVMGMGISGIDISGGKNSLGTTWTVNNALSGPNAYPPHIVGNNIAGIGINVFNTGTLYSYNDVGGGLTQDTTAGPVHVTSVSFQTLDWHSTATVGTRYGDLFTGNGFALDTGNAEQRWTYPVSDRDGSTKAAFMAAMRTQFSSSGAWGYKS